MQPDLELVHIRKGESFAAWTHGYPFRTVRWHYHPEYEIHLVVATSGRFYIGDHIGRFEPGQLIVTGPNLPQNWISEIEPDEIVPARSLVIQFPQKFVEDSIAGMVEMEAISPLLERSRRGLLFDKDTSDAVRPLIETLIETRGLKRLALFWEILDVLATAPEPEVLASLSYELDLSNIHECGVNRAIAYLREHLTDDIDERDLAEMVGHSPSSFSRAFKRHTGTTLVRYRNQLRVDLACLALLTRPETKIAEICYEIGFSNLSNFNRHFQKLKGMPPSQFRATFNANGAFKAAG
ncbi:AraC family transcriptional regulator [Rhizobium sp. Leaf262]|uniref:AraC family transcriptional regulator n=1 Tax=Rhizobium sp. Leaf262 TaxID=1736312 RepID=UPI000715AF16|nr:AraC family transcriptional regulator [Rhizobium sp. Leaf262]KQO83829.1 AraC family transcriptional regulator [Rhizobium sp. Leaf262]